jgi:hypothetical protein
MVMTQAERNYVNSSRRFKKALSEFQAASINYSTKRFILRQEKGMGPFWGEPLELDYELEHAVKNKAARTLQRYGRASTIRRRAATIGSLSRGGARRNNNTRVNLVPNVIEKIVLR